MHLETGFEPGKIYDCYYRAERPPLVGLGFTAVRDSGAFLRFGDAASGNPCAGSLDRAYVFGVSQSGRFLRHLLYLGLDEDEHGRSVFDGVIPHVAGARRGEFNCRFGQPSLNATESLGSLFPFADLPETDPVTGQRAGLLDRVRARASRPKIVAVNTSAEYWRGDASLTHIDVTGSRDVEPAPDVRAYLFAGTQHMPGTLPPPSEDANTGSRGLHVFNAVDYAPLLRAVLVNLDRWVTEGVEPPASALPRLGDGSAVPAESTAPVFRALPGMQFPDRVPRPQRLDFGPDAERGILAALPPKMGAPYVTFVSRVDADGNETAGVIRDGIGGARRDLHGLESSPSEPGRAGRSDEHDGLDDSACPNRGRASREGRSAAVHRRALRKPRSLSHPGARGGHAARDRPARPRRGRRRDGRSRRRPLGLRPLRRNSSARRAGPLRAAGLRPGRAPTGRAPRGWSRGSSPRARRSSTCSRW